MTSRGRPERHPVDVLRTRVWYQAVSSCVGNIAAARIEELLTGKGKGEDGIRRSKTWENYRAGRRVASERSLALAEERFPRTRRYFDSPIWSVFKDSIRTRREFLEAVRCLDPLVLDAIYPPGSSRSTTDPIAVMWRLRELRSLDALAGMLVYYVIYAKKMDAFLRLFVLDELSHFELDDPKLGALNGEVMDYSRAWVSRADPGGIRSLKIAEAPSG